MMEFMCRWLGHCPASGVAYWRWIDHVPDAKRGELGRVAPGWLLEAVVLRCQRCGADYVASDRETFGERGRQPESKYSDPATDFGLGR